MLTLISLIINFYVVFFNCQLISSEELNFKVALPEFVCEKNGSLSELTKNITSISFSGEQVSKSSTYKFDVNFNQLGENCRNNQRCTLMAWRAVRELNDYLTNYPSERIESGSIQIDNTMFMPGLQYVVNITIFNNDNKIVEQKQLTLDYVGEDVKKIVEKPKATLSLLGSDTTYAFMSYIINADFGICSNITKYHFTWELMDNSGDLVENFYSRGAELVIPPNTFRANNNYEINCQLFDSEKDEVLDKANQKIETLSKGIQLSLPIKALQTGTSMPIRIRAFVRDLDNSEDKISAKWNCVAVDSKDRCQFNAEPTNELELDSGILNEGQYEISVEVSKGEFIQSASCIVDVSKDLPSVEIEEVENPVNPSVGVEIRASIYQLRTQCTIQWESIDGGEEGCEILNLASVPGNIGDLVNVSLREDLFLNELEEFSNGTIDKDHNLIIPPPSGSWQGLKGDTKYMFRLSIACPSIPTTTLNDETEINAPKGKETNNNNMTAPFEALTVLPTEKKSTTDILLETNAAPEIESLEVSPLEGDAFTTLFRLQTQKAKDREGDGPLLYKFGYILDGYDVIVWSLNNVIEIETTLPYAGDAIQTFLEVCDNLGSCDRRLGPKVVTKAPGDSGDAKVMRPFYEKINTEEYYKAFTAALAATTLYKSLEDKDALKNAKSIISENILNEIEKWLGKEEDDGVKWRETAKALLKNINEFNKEFGIPESVLNKLVELRDKLSDVENINSATPIKYIKRQVLEFSKVKRSEATSLEDVKGFIEVSELMITQSNDAKRIKEEKEKLRLQLRNYLEKLCSSLYKKSQILHLELQTVILAVEKLNKNSFSTYMSIPFERNAWDTNAQIKLGSDFYESNKNNSKLCIGKVIFKDYLDKDGIIYFAQVVSGGNGEINDPDAEVIVLLPTKQIKPNLEPKCLVYDNEWTSQCKMLQKRQKYVQCSCKGLGYYFLDYEEPEAKIVTGDNTTTAPTLEIETIPVTVTQVMLITSQKPVLVENVTGNTNSTNSTLATLTSTSTSTSDTNNFESLSYIVIIGSVIGIIILALILRKVLQEEDNEEPLDTFEFPKYAPLYEEEILNDAHI